MHAGENSDADAAALNRIAEFASAAEHFWNELAGPAGASTTPLLSIDELDRFLDTSRASLTGEQQQSLMLSFGFWLGQHLVEHFGGGWIGLSEPVPPRIRVGHCIVSPIDAVAERLSNPTYPSLASRCEQLRGELARRVSREDYLACNRQAWDERHGDPRFVFLGDVAIDREMALSAIDPWLREEGIDGQRVLLLGAGGGMHGPLHAVAGANVTVVDLSPRQLSVDQAIADRSGLRIRTVRASLDQLDGLEKEEFDVVVQPVSSCYLADLQPMFREVARVLRVGGLYVSQHKQPAAVQADASWLEGGYRVAHPYFDGVPLAPNDVADNALREADTWEFIHSLEAIVGGVCRAGMVIEDLTEPVRADAWALAGSERHRACYLPPYLKLKARRVR